MGGDPLGIVNKIGRCAHPFCCCMKFIAGELPLGCSTHEVSRMDGLLGDVVPRVEAGRLKRRGQISVPLVIDL